MRYLLILLMLSPVAALAAEPFGRLFTTPAERATLDHLRQTRKIEPVNVDPTQEIIELAPVVPPSISVQGYVKRSDGKKGTVWINDQPVQESSSADGVEVGKLPKTGNGVQLKLPGIDKSLRLKAGQTYDPATNKISEESTRSNIQKSGSIGIAQPAQEATTKPEQ